MRETDAVPIAAICARSTDLIESNQLSGALSCASGVTCHKLAWRVADAVVRLTRSSAYGCTRHNLLSATVVSAVACGAACGVGKPRKIAFSGMSQNDESVTRDVPPRRATRHTSVFRETLPRSRFGTFVSMADPHELPSAATRRVMRECSQHDPLPDPFDTHLSETMGASSNVSITTTHEGQVHRHRALARL